LDRSREAAVDDAVLDHGGTPPASARPRVTWRFIACYATAVMGGWIGILTPLLVTLPLRVRELAPGHEDKALSLILAAGAFSALLTGPIAGHFSDITIGPFGFRRPWMLAGQLFQGVAAAVLISASNITHLLIGWCLMQIAYNTFLAAATAVLADKVPASQRGLVSGILGLSLPIGQLAATALAQALGPDVRLLFVAPPILSFFLTLPFLLILDDRRSRLPRGDRPEVYPETRRLGVFNLRRDFAWAWASRALFIFSMTISMTYGFFFVLQNLGQTAAQAPRAIFLGSLAQTTALIFSSFIGGRLSDQLGRRKVFVALAALAYGLGMTLIARSSSIDAYMRAMAVLGFGQGLYLAVDMALVADLLPAQSQIAKNLGIFNMASAFPQVVAPIIAPLFLGLTMGHYPPLFVAAGISALLGALCILPVKAIP
jgi:MFS family permease